MTDREKLISIIEDCRTYVANKEELVERLIANGVTIPVRCKECRYYNEDDEYCGMWGECRHPEHFCDEGVKDND